MAAAAAARRPGQAARQQHRQRQQPQQRQQQQLQPQSRQHQPQPQQQPPARRGGQFVPRRLCNRWLEGGWCWKAEACTFAHGLHELHPDVQAGLGAQVVPGAPAGTGGYPQQQAGPGPTWQPRAGLLATAGRMPGASHWASLGVSAGAGAVPLTPGAVAARPSQVAGEQRAFRFNAEAAPFQFRLNANAAPFLPSAAVLLPTAQDANGGAELGVEAGTAGLEPAAVEAGEEAGGDAAGDIGGESPLLQTAEAGVEAPGNAASTLSGESLPVAAPEEAPHTPRPRPATSLPGVVARAKPSPIRSPSDPRSEEPASAPSPEPLPTPAAAAALKFIRRNSALVPASPTTTALLLQSPASGSAVPTKLFSPHGDDLTRDPSMSTLTSELTSPVRSRRASSLVSSSGHGLGSPVSLAQSPRPVPRTPTTTPIPRAVLLQAGCVLRRIEGGPPGLAHCAPTPTSKARLIGFAYPQPGLIRAHSVAAQPASLQKPRVHRSRVSVAA